MQAGLDWMPSLADLQPEDRKSLYALSVADEGLDVGVYGILYLRPLYLRQLLEGQLEPITTGSSRLRLASPLYRMILRVCNLLVHTQVGVGLSNSVLAFWTSHSPSSAVQMLPTGALRLLLPMHAVKLQAWRFMTLNAAQGAAANPQVHGAAARHFVADDCWVSEPTALPHVIQNKPDKP